MPFSEDFLDELVRRNDIVDVVSGYVALTKRSGSNQFGLCPFHGEKTPSFSVSADKQIYHCFGCGKGGGVISFIREIEHLEFREAVEFLAKRAGMAIPEDDHDPRQNIRNRLLGLNKAAALFYRERLFEPAGAPAQAYIKKRGIGSMVKTFAMGYAPNEWQALTDAMHAKGYTNQELLDAGLAKMGKYGPYDTFRNRLMFPVVDVSKNVIGFSGRSLDDKDKGPKYMNSPETPVYSKSNSLFALNLAKNSKSGYILLAEGNIDVVSLHQAGFDNAVASLGTALTAQQARLLARYTDKIVIAYDNDSAGQKAAERAIGILQPMDFKINVVKIPGAKDPDEFIQANGPQAFRDLIERSGNQMEYRLDQLASQFDLQSDEGRVDYLKAAIKLIATLPSAVTREIYGTRCAEKAGVSRDAFLPEVERTRRQNEAKAKKKLDREASAPLRAAQPKDRELRFENVRSAVAEKGVLNLLCRFPEQFEALPLTGADFTSPALGRMYDAVTAQIRQGRKVSIPALEQQFSREELDLLADILQHDEIPAHAAGQAMDDYIKKIRAEKDKASRSDDMRGYAEKLKRTKGYGRKDGREEKKG